MQRILSELVEKLKKAHGARLASVILYGSAASEDGQDKLSDFNVLCVLDAVDVEDLERSEMVFRWWREQKNPAPVLLSRDEVRTSTDSFPMEFHDMKERRNVLFGDDVIDGLTVDDSFYRAMVEHELRAKMVRLRTKASTVLHDSDMLARLMLESISTFCVLFRHAIWLSGGTPKFDKREVVEASRERFGIDPKPLLSLLDVREGTGKASDLQAASLFRVYIKQIQLVLDAVDRLEK